MQVQTVTPDLQDEDQSLLDGISIDVLIDALTSAIVFQGTDEEKRTKILIKALEAAKIFA